ncbi:MAG TPA: hypothetical protein DF383_12735, partial [Deltaproteobacteria bacterium]|nr:hypothetical protein [Deltaproteobacteria bacterium]
PPPFPALFSAIIPADGCKRTTPGKKATPAPLEDTNLSPPKRNRNDRSISLILRFTDLAMSTVDVAKLTRPATKERGIPKTLKLYFFSGETKDNNPD